jgi:hypothetical protein
VLHHIVLTYDGTRAGQYVLVKFRACIIYCQAKFLDVHVPYFRVKQPPALVCNRKLSPRVFLCQYGTYDLFLSCHVQSECFSGSWCSQHRQLAQVIFYSSERFPLCVPPHMKSFSCLSRTESRNDSIFPARFDINRRK